MDQGQIVLHLEKKTSKVELKMNTKKSKVFSLTDYWALLVCIMQNKTDGVDQFVYLDSVVTAEGSVFYPILSFSRSYAASGVKKPLKLFTIATIDRECLHFECDHSVPLIEHNIFVSIIAKRRSLL